ncbi:MAG: allantoinase AllB [Bacteroidetes bacterium]|nr:allantoinase AllB [Bacteroidota bacterium]
MIFSERCWWQGKLQPATVVCENGIITEIFPFKAVDAEDFGNDVIMPGLIDAHVHINEPGRTEWEGFITATKAAAAGGITTIIDMPLNSSPVTTTADAFIEKKEAATDKLFVNVGLYGGLVKDNINEIEALIQQGVFGIKCFLVHSGIDDFPNVGEKELNEAMPLIAKHHLPLLAHCELYDKEADCALDLHPGSYKEYLASRPKQWENDAVALMISLCRKHHCPIHIVHVSSAEALQLIADAKKEGLPITAETCAHYIYFNAEDISDNNTVFKCAPPIREKANNILLKQALKNGILDFITTDHSPAPPEIKQVASGNFKTGWGGIAGLQFLLPASWTALMDSMALEKFIPLVTEHPAVFLSLNTSKGKIDIGYDADFVIWNPDQSMIVKEESIYHRHTISPYTGEKLFGVTRVTIVKGVTVYDSGNFIADEIKNGSLLIHE